jgi:asparagine synthase (glutamine-hydrolysing)
VPRSTLLSLASRAPVFLRRGIWPISPFASLDAVRFCRRLPAEWRNNKHLHRAVLAHSGCASTTVYPELHENFHSVLTEALRLKQYSLLRDLFAHSKLAAAGFVEKQKLLKAYDIYAKNGRLAGDERFYEVAVLELLLRGA